MNKFVDIGLVENNKPRLLNRCTALCDNRELFELVYKLEEQIRIERAKLVTQWQLNVASALAEENFQPAVATYASRHCRTKHGAKNQAIKMMKALAELQKIKTDQE